MFTCARAHTHAKATRAKGWIGEERGALNSLAHADVNAYMRVRAATMVSVVLGSGRPTGKPVPQKNSLPPCVRTCGSRAPPQFTTLLRKISCGHVRLYFSRNQKSFLPLPGEQHRLCLIAHCETPRVCNTQENGVWSQRPTVHWEEGGACIAIYELKNRHLVQSICSCVMTSEEEIRFRTGRRINFKAVEKREMGLKHFDIAIYAVPSGI